MHVEKAIAIDKSPEELFSFWREFQNLPKFMKHLESVTCTGINRSHWVAKGPGGKNVEWDAEIYNEKPNEMIAWRSLRAPTSSMPDQSIQTVGCTRHRSKGRVELQRTGRKD